MIMRKCTMIAACMIMVLLAVTALGAPEMVLVKAGTFQMGDEVGDLPDWANAKPAHTVTLTYDYWIGKHEVTFDQFDVFCDATGMDKLGDEGWGRGTRPVINVNWWDAIAYCNWLSQREGLPVAYRLRGENDEGSLLNASGDVTEDITQVVGYRLPTEAEWEYAARGGHKSEADYKYAGSDDIDTVAWYNNNSGWMTQPVGQKKANELGLYDMSGNAAEWCHDHWDRNYYEQGDKTNPVGSSIGTRRMYRGGSSRVRPENCHVAYRLNVFPIGSSNDLGFRLVRTAF